jgi:hypothetical protein
MCPAWSPSELTPAVRRRLFIVLMTAAHISPNVFSLQNFLSDIHGLFLTVHSTSFISIIHHIYTHTYIFYLHDIFILSFLRIFMTSRLPSVPCVQYNIYCTLVLSDLQKITLYFSLMGDFSCWISIKMVLPF